MTKAAPPDSPAVARARAELEVAEATEALTAAKAASDDPADRRDAKDRLGRAKSALEALVNPGAAEAAASRRAAVREILSPTYTAEA